MSKVYYLWLEEGEAGPFDLSDIRLMIGERRIDWTVNYRMASGPEWVGTLADLPALQPPKLPEPLRKVAPKSMGVEPQRIVVVGVEMPMDVMLRFMLRWMIASIPAAFLFGLFLGLVYWTATLLVDLWFLFFRVA